MPDLFKIQKIDQASPKPDFDNLGFGKLFTDHMFIAKYSNDKGWYDSQIQERQSLKLDPAACSLHYGQCLFEGMKAFKGDDGKLALFRPHFNWRRMKHGAERLCMEMPNEELFIEAAKALVKIDSDWMPEQEQGSLYIRPTLIANEAFLGVRPSNEYLFYIILSPVGSYYENGLSPVKIWVEEDYLRAAPGGLGNIKASANYAGSLKAAQLAKARKCDQVLWLDVNKEHIEEVGTMNVFFVFKDEIVTPALSGSILPGKTRDCALQILKDQGYPVSERPLKLQEVVAKQKEGQLKEIFGTGTAAVISSVGQLKANNWDFTINDEQIGPISQMLYDKITAIQNAKIEDKYDWRKPLN